MAIGTYISIITLNINGLNAPTKRHTLVDWIQKEDLYNMLYTRDPLQTYRHIHTESEGMEKYFYANGNQKKAGVAILISDKIDFKIMNVVRDKEGHYVMIKGSIQEEDITIVNIYAPNKGTPQYRRQMLTAIKKGEIDSNTIIVGTLTPH